MPVGADAAASWSPFPDAAGLTMQQVLFLTGMYGYVLFNAANILSDGSELLLLVPQLAPIVGSIVLPILGAVPDGLMVLFSGLGDDAQNQISVGVGALAGSTIMLLTIPWSLAVVYGRVTLKDGKPQYKRPAGAGDDWEKLDPKHKWSLTHTGVGLSDTVTSMAKMMIGTMLGYFIIQGACTYSEWQAGGIEEQAAFQSKFALVGLVICLAEFCYYLKACWAETRSGGAVEDVIVQKQQDEIMGGRITLRGAMADFRGDGVRLFGNMSSMDEDGLQQVLLNPSCMNQVRRMVKLLGPFFKQYDKNHDQSISQEEFQMIFRDLNETNMTRQAIVELFQAADTDNDTTINFEEFVACFMSFAMDPGNSLEASIKPPSVSLTPPVTVTPPPPDPEAPQARDAGGDPEDDEEEGEEQEEPPPDLADLSPAEQQWAIKKRAGFKMLLGTALVIVFSDPMVDLLSEIGKRLNISAFYISFVLAPLASNASELVAAMNYANKKTLKGMTTALSALQGAAVMNNTFCLGIFLALVYFKSLAWEFTAETVSIIVAQILVVLSVFNRQSMSLLNGIVILGVYPVSLLTVYVLENFCGLD